MLEGEPDPPPLARGRSPPGGCPAGRGPVTARQMKNLRARLDWSQERLAEALGVHPMTVSKWERGENAIPRLAELACKWIESQEGGE